MNKFVQITPIDYYLQDRVNINVCVVSVNILRFHYIHNVLFFLTCPVGIYNTKNSRELDDY